MRAGPQRRSLGARLGNHKSPGDRLHSGGAHDAIATVDARSAIEIEVLRASLFGDDLEGRKIPGLSAGFDPYLGLSSRDHHGVQASTHAANRPKLLHPSDQSGGKPITPDAV